MTDNGETSEKNLYPISVTPHFHGQEHVSKAQLTQNPTNRRKSTRYTWWNFLPITLMLQFAKVVNCFYIFTGILQFFPAIQTNKPFVILVPTFFVIGIGILKELLAELKRLSDDNKFNEQVYERVCPVGH